MGSNKDGALASGRDQQSWIPESMLSEDGELKPDVAAPLSDEQSLEAYRWMLLSRMFDDRAYKLQRQGRLGTFAAGSGQEATAVGVSMALRLGGDWLVPAYREVAALLRHGWNLRDAILYYRGHPQGWTTSEDFRALPMQVALAAQLQHAVGLAWGQKLQRRDDVVVTFVGDGGTSEGDFHEALNFAGVLGAPLVVVIQNNQWAISTPRESQTATRHLASRGVGYGMTAYQVDGNDLFAVYVAAKRAIAQARAGAGPVLIEALTFRLRPHNTADDSTRYTDPDALADAQVLDPLGRFRAYLEKHDILSPDEHEKLTEGITGEIDGALAAADAYPAPDAMELFEHVWSARPERLEQQRRALAARIGRADA